MEIINTQESRETPGPVKVTQNPELLSARFNRFGLPACIFAVLFCFGIYKNPGGIAFTVPVAGAYILFSRLYGADHADRRTKDSYQIFLALSCLLLSVNVWTSASRPLQVSDKLGILVLTAVCLLRIRPAGIDGAAGPEPDPIAYLLGIVRTAFMPISRIFIPFTDTVAAVRSRFGERNRIHKGKAGAILKGVLISLPLLLTVVLLLSDADAVFCRLLADLLSGFSIPELTGRWFLILFTAAAGFILFYTVSTFFFGESTDTAILKNTNGTGEPLTAITVLSLLTAVYVCFCGIQLFYLTGTLQLPQGLTYAQYAHEGFYQLAIVCTLNLAIVLICRSRCRSHRLLTILLFIMSCCTFIMIASSAARMVLYIREYQLTFLRLAVLWFLAVLTIWLILVCISLLRKQLPLFRACLAAVTILYLLFAFAHPDYWIAKYNLSASGIRDSWYIVSRLSDDAVPAYADDPQMCSDRAMIMKDRLHWREETGRPAGNGLRTFNLSESAAGHRLGY